MEGENRLTGRSLVILPSIILYISKIPCCNVFDYAISLLLCFRFTWLDGFFFDLRRKS